MGYQKDDIRQKASQLGIDSGNSSSELDQMKKIAESVGMKNYNGLSNADTDELERRLKELESQRQTQQQPQQTSSHRNNDNLLMRSKLANSRNLNSIMPNKNSIFGKRMAEDSRKSFVGKKDATDTSNNEEEVENKNSKQNDNSSFGIGSGKGAKSLFLKSLMFKILLFCGCLCFIIVFFIALISTVYESRLGSVVLGTLTSGDKSLLNGVIDEIGEGDGVSAGNIDTSIYYERLKALGNVFSSEPKCEKEDCSDRPEVRYYLKVADIALRYKNKYHVNLDWVLLNATMMFSDSDEEATMKRALNDYDLDAVEDYDQLMNLDWDYDYKDIPGYIYLDPDDYRYDLQILAKNMVTKKTTQKCVDKDGNETKSQEDIDIEAQYFEPGEKYYLKCDKGETYSIINDYSYDAEKYDDFLLEYIERKFYTPSNSGNNSDINIDLGDYSGTDLASTFVNIALSQEGIEGTPNKFTRWLGAIQGYPDNGYSYPWCATFVSWAIEFTEYEGQKLKDIINVRSAGVYAFANYFTESGNVEYVLSKNNGGNYVPKQGDLIFFDWDCSYSGIGSNDHIGIVVEAKDGYVYTIEGNTSNSVATRKYSLDSCSVSAYGVWY